MYIFIAQKKHTWLHHQNLIFTKNSVFFTKRQTKQAINYNTMADTARYLRILWYAAIVIVLNQRISFKPKDFFKTLSNEVFPYLTKNSL